ncbi:hypothetical protein QBC44DRAFT_375942, partial [Cladorrhinum sp. PSN332]
MDLNAIVNHSNIHDSPSADRFYRLQIQRNSIPKAPQLRLRPRAQELTRDDKHTIQVLRKFNRWDYFQIAKETGFTWGQVQYACRTPLTPRKTKHCGRKPTRFDASQKAIIQHALDNDPIARKLNWPDLQWYLPGFEFFGEQSFAVAMRAAGFDRGVRPRRILLTDAHKAARLAFAYEQLALRPNPEDWEDVVFSDETWATNSPMWKQWITYHYTEDLEAWALIREKPHGWMFWGSFAGRRKGPSFFWEKEYGGITAEKYQHHIIPRVHTFLEENG